MNRLVFWADLISKRQSASPQPRAKLLCKNPLPPLATLPPLRQDKAQTQPANFSMRLLRLELQGFKSFPDRMAVDFIQDGVSIIVGPNGCGKSNLVDAIRWVLGEQSAKNLRGGSMEDVIFNGSASRPPVGLSQVSLHFSNPQHDTLNRYAEFSEISVSRKLYRSGESQYLINKTPCRLTDIRNLFMDTGIGGKGYSIIEQGRIDRIVTSNASDRRSIIDEAAGIVKFKTKRIEAERKFQQSRQNLDRVQDVLAELEIQEESLAKQVQQAEKFLEAKSRFERLTQCLSAVQWKKLQDQGLALVQQREDQRSEQNNLEVQTQALEAKKAALDASTATQRGQLDQMKEEIAEKNRNAIQLEGKIASDQRELANLDAWEERGLQEKEDLTTREEKCKHQLETLEFDLDEIVDHSRTIDQAKEEIQTKLHAQTQVLEGIKADIQALKQEEIELRSHQSGHGEELAQLKERSLELAKKEALTQQRLTETASALSQNKAWASSLLQKIEVLEEQKETLVEQAVTYKARIEEEEASFGKLDDAIEEKTKKLHQSDSRLQSIEEFLSGHEDFSGGAKALLDYLSLNPHEADRIGFIGSLTDLVRPGASTPKQVQAFLDRHFDLLIFRYLHKYPQIETLLENLKIDQLELCFLDLRPPGPALQNSIEQWIQWEKDPLHLAEQFVYLGEALSGAEKGILSQNHGLVDHKGHLLSKEKILHLGKRREGSKADLLLSRRRELESLTQTVEGLQKEVQNLEAQEIQQKETLERLDDQYEAVQKQRVELDLKLLDLNKEQEAQSQEQNRLEQRRDELEIELAEALAGQKRFAERMLALEEGLSSKEDRFTTLSEELKVFQARLETEETKKAFIQGEGQHLEVRLAALKEKKESAIRLKARISEDLAQAQERARELIQNQVEQRQKRLDLTQEVHQAQAALPALLEALKAKEKQARDYRGAIEETLQEITETGKLLKIKLKEIDHLKEARHEIDIQLAQAAQEAKNLEGNLLDEHGIKPEEVLETLHLDSFEVTQAEAESKKLKKVIEQIEGVNLAAKKEYDALMERLTFLREQSQDLLSSIEALEESISEMDAESGKRFKSTFKTVNENFKALFPKLFGGGEASLRLTDEKDLLTSGVEIIAQPPGKKLQNMTLLSGGEKAMTAIALIFAIFRMKPSPFCLLDEVDAPLDDANNGRFNEEVKAMTANSQFIIITHNKKTMEIGDALFGVTMEEPGASKIVSVDFREAQRQLDTPLPQTQRSKPPAKSKKAV